MAQTSLAEFYVRRSSVTSSVDQGFKEGLEEPISAKDEMLAAYGASGLPAWARIHIAAAAEAPAGCSWTAYVARGHSHVIVHKSNMYQMTLCNGAAVCAVCRGQLLWQDQQEVWKEQGQCLCTAC